MRFVTLRLVAALLTFAIGLSASALWKILRPTPKQRSFSSTLTLTNSSSSGASASASASKSETFTETVTTMRAIVPGGVLNGKAISKPAPEYPAIARAARASGTVAVNIIVDEEGRVISANPVSGHPLLQQAAAQAAREARFSPTLLSGQPIKVSGVLTYNFALE